MYPKTVKKSPKKKRNLRNTAGFVDGESHFAVVVSVVILTDSFGLNPFWIDDRFLADEPVGFGWHKEKKKKHKFVRYHKSKMPSS